MCKNISLLFALNSLHRDISSTHIFISGFSVSFKIFIILCSINKTICMKEGTNCLLIGLLQGTLINMRKLCGLLVLLWCTFFFLACLSSCYNHCLTHKYLNIILALEMLLKFIINLIEIQIGPAFSSWLYYGSAAIFPDINF